MNDWDFNQSRLFLENMIANHMENTEVIKELLQTYRNLLDNKAQVYIQLMKSDESTRTEWEKNQTERIKAQADITKTSLEKGTQPPYQQNNTILGGM